MFICYFDESGDDGFPKYSSNLFVLTSIYMHHLLWKDNYEKVFNFRKHLKDEYKIPINVEFHFVDFVKNKYPYKLYNINDKDRKHVVQEWFDFIKTLDIKVINVCINKLNITTPQYDVLDNAFKYNIQRIENDLNSFDPSSKFLIISDEGRVGKMVKIARKIQKINYIPSRYGGSYNRSIQKLIEDPLPKNSKQSYFIQISDMIAFIVYLYIKKNILNEKWSRRMLNVLDYGVEITFLDKIINILNIKASSTNKYGVVVYP